MPSWILLLLPALLLVAAGCGEDSTSEAPTPVPVPADSSAEPTEEPTPQAETDDCRVAAATWTDRVADHALDGSTTAPAFGERLDIENLDDLESEMSVLCSEDLNRAVTKVRVPLTLMNYELSLCAFEGRCAPAAADKVRGLASKTAQANNRVRDLI